MNKKTTLFDLFASASKAASENLDKTGHAEHDAVSESFKATGHDGADFDQWRTYYGDERQRFSVLRTQLAPSAKIVTEEKAEA